MAIIGSLRKIAARRSDMATDREMVMLSACMTAMLDEIAALEAQGILGDGFAAAAQPAETGNGSISVILSVT